MERLQKIIAESGFCSRRKAEEYIKLGKELENLRNDGKMKTTKFKELLGKKLVYSMIINIFKRYDLIDN